MWVILPLVRTGIYRVFQWSSTGVTKVKGKQESLWVQGSHSLLLQTQKEAEISPENPGARETSFTWIYKSLTGEVTFELDLKVWVRF